MKNSKKKEANKSDKGSAKNASVQPTDSVNERKRDGQEYMAQGTDVDPNHRIENKNKSMSKGKHL